MYMHGMRSMVECAIMLFISFSFKSKPILAAFFMARLPAIDPLHFRRSGVAMVQRKYHNCSNLTAWLEKGIAKKGEIHY